MKKNTQKKNRFNIIDFTLIVAVLACIIGITVRYNLRDTVVDGANSATVTVMIRGILKENVEHLVEGDQYYYQRSGELIGTLKSFETQPSKIRNIRHDGTVVTTEYVDRTDVICTVDIEGINTDEGFLVGGSEYIGCGSGILVRSLNLETEWLVVDIEVHQ